MGRVGIPIREDMHEYAVEYINTALNNLFGGFNFDTKEALDVYYELLTRVNAVSNYDPQIWAVIQEDSYAFFSGQKSAEEVAAMIQDRAQTIMSERYG